MTSFFLSAEFIRRKFGGHGSCRAEKILQTVGQESNPPRENSSGKPNLSAKCGYYAQKIFSAVQEHCPPEKTICQSLFAIRPRLKI